MTYFGFAISDSMFDGDCSIKREVLSFEEVKNIIQKGVIPCLNPSHKATINAMQERFGINVEIPETAPKVQLKKDDSLIVMTILGLPRLSDSRHEYTQVEVDSAIFSFAKYIIE